MLHSVDNYTNYFTFSKFHIYKMSTVSALIFFSVWVLSSADTLCASPSLSEVIERVGLIAEVAHCSK